MAKGLYYYKLVSQYPEDVTKNCKLTINEIDSNFFELKNDDISAVTWTQDKGEDGTYMPSGWLVISKKGTNEAGEHETLSVHLDTDLHKNLTYDFDASTEKDSLNRGTNLTITYRGLEDGETHKLEIKNIITSDNLIDVIGSDVLTKVISDSTLRGLGTIKSPLGLAGVERTGMLAPVIKVVDMTTNCSHEELPEPAPYGDRYVTKEYIHDFGYLYNGRGVEKIQRILDEEYNGINTQYYKEFTGDTEEQKRLQYWHVPTKGEWDKLLNSIEPCNHRNHDSAQCHVELGKFAGKFLKSECGWFNSKCDFTCHERSYYEHCNAEPISGINEGDTTYEEFFDNTEVMPRHREICSVGVDKYGMTILPAGVALADKLGNIAPHDFKNTSVFWTTTKLGYGQDTYVKIFDWNRSGVFQSAECPGPYYSVRLVKEYNGNNYKPAEYINGVLYDAVLFPESGQIWLASNFAGIKGFDNCEWEGETPDFVEVNDGEGINNKRVEMYVNEYNGRYWEKRILNEGETVVVQIPFSGDTMSGTTEVVWYDEDGIEHKVIVDIPQSIQDNAEYRVKLVDDGCDKILVNTDELVTERVIQAVAPIILKETYEREKADVIINNRIDQEIADRISDVNEEEARAKEAEAALSGAIDTEREERQAADELLYEAIEEEKQKVISAETELNEKIEQEIADRISDVNEEEARAKEAEAALSGAIDTETARAISAETALDEKIDAEVTRTETEEHRLDEKIDKEIVDREAACELLNEKIDNEIADRIADVDEEEDRAKEVETTLNEKIDAEAERSISADTTLSGAIDTEREERIASVDEEEARAKAVEAELSGLTFVSDEPYTLHATSVNSESDYNLIIKSKDGVEDHFIKIKFDGNFGKISFNPNDYYNM